MRKLFAVLLLTSPALPVAHGQANSAPPPRPLPTPKAATPAPVKPEKPSAEKPAAKRSLAERLFGARPTPTPAPTPAPVVKHQKPKAKPADMPEEATTKTTPKVTPKETTAATPAATTTNTPKPKGGKAGGRKAAATVANPEDEAAKFKNAKAKAQEDAHVKELKNKADSEVNESEAQKALVNYNRALFQKIREIDPSVSEYAGKVEQALSRRVGAEKSKE